MKALLLLLVAFCAVLPVRYIAVALPALWALQRLAPSEAAMLFRAGPVEVFPTDLVLLALLARFACTVGMRKELAADRALYAALGVYFAANLVATFAAGIKFGAPQLAASVTALARLASEIMLLPIVAQAVRTLPEARRCARILLGTLAAFAAIQFVNSFGVSRGFFIGEVQGIERGELRYFGPVGDSVGMVLLLGYAWALCAARVAGAALFLGGIVLTAGLGAILAAGVATALFLALGMRTDAVRDFARRGAWALPLIAFAALLAATVFAKPLAGTLVERLSTGNYASSGAQRSASAAMAGAMILDNPLFGVGYMGYERALARYGGEKFFDLGKSDGATANANNQFLQSLTDGGVCGLLACALFLACAVRLLWRVAARCDDPALGAFFLAACLWLLAMVFGNLAAVWLNPSSFVARLLWITLGLAVAVQRLLPAPEPQPASAREGGEPAQPLPA